VGKKTGGGRVITKKRKAKLVRVRSGVKGEKVTRWRFKFRWGEKGGGRPTVKEASASPDLSTKELCTNPGWGRGAFEQLSGMRTLTR